MNFMKFMKFMNFMNFMKFMNFMNLYEIMNFMKFMKFMNFYEFSGLLIFRDILGLLDASPVNALCSKWKFGIAHFQKHSGAAWRLLLMHFVQSGSSGLLIFRNILELLGASC